MTPPAIAIDALSFRYPGSASEALSGLSLEVREGSLFGLQCPHCGARRKLIALISDGVVVRKILDHLGLPSEPPILARARVSEELDFSA